MAILFTLRGDSRFVALLLALVAFELVARAQNPEVTAIGQVQAVYLSTKISQPVYVVQLRADEVVLNDQSTRRRGLRLPQEGETLFIVCNPGSNGLSSRLKVEDLPQPETGIRALLVSGDPGEWLPAGASWFEPIATSPTTAGKSSDDSPEVNLRGMACEAIVREGRLAFVVKSVAASGPAHDAGFQVGDIVVSVDGQPVNSLAALRDLAAKSAALELSVVDVNTGQLAQVDLAYERPRTTESSPKQTSPVEIGGAEQVAQSLGVEVTVSRIGFRTTALAVSKVDPRGAAADAGVEVGDVIIAANDLPVASIDDLAAALPSAGGKTTLLIRNVRGGEDVPVEVQSRPRSAGQETEKESTEAAPPQGATDAFGLATELAFYHGEAAVRITGVERASPAAEAGLKAGWLILAADGKPVLHPDELKAAEKRATSRMRIRVADPRTGKESEMDLTR